MLEFGAYRNKKEAWEVDEADDIDGKLGDDQENPGDKLQKGAPGQQSPDQLTKLAANDKNYRLFIHLKTFI